MTNELRSRHQSRNQFVRDYSSVYRDGVEIFDPSVWLQLDPDAEEKMLRDSDIAHAVGYRRHLIAGQRWTCTPRDDNETDEAVAAAQLGATLLGHIKHFGSARVALARAFFSGARFARIRGCTKVLTLGDDKPRTWWVPTALEDLDKRMFRPVAKNDGEHVSAYWERWDVAQMKWVPETQEDAIQTIRHVYQDDQSTLGHGRALREALGWWWHTKTNLIAESCIAAEKHGVGTIRAKIAGLRDAATGLPNQEMIRQWTATLENLRARHVLVHDRDDEVDILTPGGTGWQMLREFREDARQSITTLVLGANVNTTATEGGSYALAEVHEGTTEALVQFDRQTLEETLTDDLLGCVWYRNWPNLAELGLHKLCPKFDLTQEKRQDPAQRAQVAAQLSQMGVELALDDVLDQTGFRRPKPGEDVVKAQPAQPAGQLGFPGFGDPLQ